MCWKGCKDHVCEALHFFLGLRCLLTLLVELWRVCLLCTTAYQAHVQRRSCILQDKVGISIFEVEDGLGVRIPEVGPVACDLSQVRFPFPIDVI